mgnify:CR=1 FL=1
MQDCGHSAAAAGLQLSQVWPTKGSSRSASSSGQGMHPNLVCPAMYMQELVWVLVCGSSSCLCQHAVSGASPLLL